MGFELTATYTPKARAYPVLAAADGVPREPISIVVVRYSDDFVHNIVTSEAVKNPGNELVVVDNRGNVFFDNLSSAIRQGIEVARHNLVVVAHEDVVLPPGWQARFERSLGELERYDPEWGVVGSVGWTKAGELVGHWSDPQQYNNSFADGGPPYVEVERIDEQILILRKSRAAILDGALPSIHWVGWDVPLSERSRGRKTYVIDAPTIHKYADAQGHLIQSPSESPKIVARASYTWKAEKSCCDDYFFAKWPLVAPDYRATAAFGAELAGDWGHRVGAPLILLAKGGGGSRLLSLLAQDAGLFIGNQVSASGDSLEMVNAIYKGVIEKYRCQAGWQRDLVVDELRGAAHQMLELAGFPKAWGFKLPESLLILPEIAAAFPQARFVHLVRDPLSTCLRRTHMTARLDNEIGRVALPLAYRALGLPLARILEDSPAEHMAYTTRHQLEQVLDLRRTLPPSRFLQLSFEDLMRRPRWVRLRLERWLRPEGLDRLLYDLQTGWRAATGKREPGMTEKTLDPARTVRTRISYPAEVERKVSEILAELRARLGYR